MCHKTSNTTMTKIKKWLNNQLFKWTRAKLVSVHTSYWLGCSRGPSCILILKSRFQSNPQCYEHKTLLGNITTLQVDVVATAFLLLQLIFRRNSVYSVSVAWQTGLHATIPIITVNSEQFVVAVVNITKRHSCRINLKWALNLKLNSQNDLYFQPALY